MSDIRHALEDLLAAVEPYRGVRHFDDATVDYLCSLPASANWSLSPAFGTLERAVRVARKALERG